ncbi:hypothetical protein NESM_000539700 [Novymonas esmeraldas]|uniref:BRCT domain-containing protein n=1 Tax=Novymonas esmeraldas TaxID=1808958 RepID=A0AAW0ERA9_9TRYP
MSTSAGGGDGRTPRTHDTRAPTMALMLLHQQLVQHQTAANGAFASLDSACCSVAATLSSPPPPRDSGSASPQEAVAVDGTSSTRSHPRSAARLFTELLRRVEVLHQFLFTNLHIHHRECVLRLLADVERCVVVGGAAAAAQPPTPADTADVSSGDGDEDEAQRELRRQIVRLRSRLAAHPAHHLAMSGLTSAQPPQAPEVSSTASLSATAGTCAPALSAVSEPASSPRMHSGAEVPPATQTFARAGAPRVHLFALSSAFNTRGAVGHERLAAVLAAAQCRFRVHAVVLGRTSGPAAQVDAAVRLGCVCLVVPHEEVGAFASHPSLIIASDRAVLAHVDGHGGADAATPPNAEGVVLQVDDGAGGAEAAVEEEDWEMLWDGEGGDGGGSALDELFLALEADLPRMSAATDSLWLSSPPAFNGGSADDVLEARVVERAALHRDARHTSQWRKRSRLDGGPSTSNHSSAAPSTSVRTRRTGADLSVSGVGVAEQYREMDVHSDGAPLSQLGAESQHVGITQNMLVPRFSSTSSDSGHVTPVLRPREGDDHDGVGDAGAADTHEPTRMIFQISNSVRYQKAQLTEAIEQLGGVVDQSSGYSRGCRYLVAAEGITERTEKFLGACAAAAFVVPPRFVFDSQRRGYWLTRRAHEYDMNPQRAVAHAPRAAPIFSNWRVVLITCRAAAARGVRAALLAGGCAKAIAFVVDVTADAPLDPSVRQRVYDEDSCAGADGVVEGMCSTSAIAAQTLQSATHILVECTSVSALGYFQMPSWVPACVRQPELHARTFTLELLYFCLCAHPERVFDADGALSAVDALTPACRVEPP